MLHGPEPAPTTPRSREVMTQPKGRARPQRFGLVGAVAVLAIVLSACSTGMPPGATKEGRDIHSLYLITFWLAVIVFIGVEGAILWCVLRYRRKPKDNTLPPQIHGNNVVELIWFLIPVVICVVLYSFSTSALARL